MMDMNSFLHVQINISMFVDAIIGAIGAVMSTIEEDSMVAVVPYAGSCIQHLFIDVILNGNFYSSICILHYGIA